MRFATVPLACATFEFSKIYPAKRYPLAETYSILTIKSHVGFYSVLFKNVFSVTYAVYSLDVCQIDLCKFLLFLLFVRSSVLSGRARSYLRIVDGNRLFAGLPRRLVLTLAHVVVVGIRFHGLSLLQRG